jgi:DnaJ homolog subfamily A member 2
VRLSSLTLSADALKVIPGEGMPSQRHHEPGDLFIRVAVKFPESMPLDSIPLLERALPPRKPVEKFAKNVILEETEVVEADARQQEFADAGEAMDEDEEGAEGEPRVQCANQ